jgi:nitrogen regulatory protein P-II 2
LDLYPLKLVTVIGESLIMRDIAEKGVKLGATGFTITQVEGDGPRSSQNVEIAPGGKTLKVEFVVPTDVATTILTHISEEYFEHYSIVAWLSDVMVIRGALYLNGIK